MTRVEEIASVYEFMDEGGHVVYVAQGVSKPRVLRAMKTKNLQYASFAVVHNLPAASTSRAVLNALVDLRVCMAIHNGNKPGNQTTGVQGNGVRCVETDQAWRSLLAMSTVTGLLSSSVNNVLHGRSATLNGLHWELVNANDQTVKWCRRFSIISTGNGAEDQLLTDQELAFVQEERACLASLRNLYAVPNTALKICDRTLDLATINVNTPVVYAVVEDDNVLSVDTMSDLSTWRDVLAACSSTATMYILAVNTDNARKYAACTPWYTIADDAQRPVFSYTITDKDNDKLLVDGLSDTPLQSISMRFVNGACVGMDKEQVTITITDTELMTKNEMREQVNVYVAQKLSETMTRDDSAILCGETGEAWFTTTEAALWTGANQARIAKAASGNIEKAGGLHWCRLMDVKQVNVHDRLSSTQQVALAKALRAASDEPAVYSIYELVEHDHVVYVGQVYGAMLRQRLYEHTHPGGRFVGRQVTIREHARYVCTHAEALVYEELHTYEMRQAGEPVENHMAGARPLHKLRKQVLGDKVLQCVETEKLYINSHAVQTLMGIRESNCRHAASDPDKYTAGGFHWRWVRTNEVNEDDVQLDISTLTCSKDDANSPQEVDTDLLDKIMTSRRRYMLLTNRVKGHARVVNPDGSWFMLSDMDYACVVYQIVNIVNHSVVLTSVTQQPHIAWTTYQWQLTSKLDPNVHEVRVMSVHKDMYTALNAAADLTGRVRLPAVGRVPDGCTASTVNSWKAMHMRCSDPNHPSYTAYGQRGVKVCAQWSADGGVGLANFFADMGNAPDDCTLDRLNGNGDYEPTNCRWATRQQQAANRSDARLITFNGETHTAAEWARINGVDVDLVYTSLKLGAQPEDVVHGVNPWPSTRTPATEVVNQHTPCVPFPARMQALGEKMYGRLQPLGVVDEINGHTRILADCTCGRRVVVAEKNIVRTDSRCVRSCGCLDTYLCGKADCQWTPVEQVLWARAVKYGHIDYLPWVKSMDTFINAVGRAPADATLDTLRLNTRDGARWESLQPVEPGARFGKLTVLERTVTGWLCKCTCGETVDVPAYMLRNGKVRSCGKRCGGNYYATR